MKRTMHSHLKLKHHLIFYQAAYFTCKDWSIRAGRSSTFLYSNTPFAGLSNCTNAFTDSLCRWHIVLKYLDTLKAEIAAPEILNKVGFLLVE